ncbi:N-acetylneuraminate synthase family protein [Lysinibacillus sp. NPDC056185]|uniref:N-acetylneuraminate synthase family protein n=1 Tax=Lysinibacillus sp. NPDC056185 TaxID=3345739 RepID=UPI0039EED87B
MNKPKIIAEIANAHQGDFKQLMLLVNEVKEIGAGAIKFQWFKYDSLSTPDYEWYETYKELFFTEEQWNQVLEHCQKLKLEVWIDIFDSWGLEMARKYQDKYFGIKIPATIIQSKALINNIKALNKPLLIGIGGWYEEELEDLFKNFTNYQEKITYLHGYQGYPTKTKDSNLIRILETKLKYNIKVGFADHEDASLPTAVSIPKYAMFAGAEVIEKHITLDRSLKGYDYYSSLEPSEFKKMIDEIKNASIIMGSSIIYEEERAYLNAAVRVVTKRHIKKGEYITVEDIEYKRCNDTTAFMPHDFEANEVYIAQSDMSENQPVNKQVVRKAKVVIGVVGRLKSTRLLKKALMPLNGITSIERCIINCQAANIVDEVVLATSDLAADAELEKANLNGTVKVIKGDADNVLDRLLQVATETEADILLRVTGDCPVISPEVIDLMVREHIKNNADATLTDLLHPIGIAPDVYDVKSLIKLSKYDNEFKYTEYLSFYFKNNVNIFKVQMISLPEEFNKYNWRLTLDEILDYNLFEHIYKDLVNSEEPIYYVQLKEYLLKNPKIAYLNHSVSLKWAEDEELIQKINKSCQLT